MRWEKLSVTLAPSNFKEYISSLTRQNSFEKHISKNKAKHLQKQKRKNYISMKYWKTENVKEQQDKYP